MPRSWSATPTPSTLSATFWSAKLDATKAALAKASKRSGFAVLPYKGPNGTWRRPIVIECNRGGANLQPRGPRFTVLDLSPRIRPGSSIFVKAVARELFHIQSAETPDGTPAVPYIVFLVRPDGVAPYYLARTCLEPLGIAFGYELVEQNLAVNIPDFDDLTTWDGTVPLDLPLERAPGASSSSSRLAQANQTLDQSRTGTASLPRTDPGAMIGTLEGAGGGDRQRGQGTASYGRSQPEDFVWPGRGRQSGGNGGQPSGALGDPGRENGLAGGVSPRSSQDGGPGGKSTGDGALAGGAPAGQFLAKGDPGGSGGNERNGGAGSGSGDAAGDDRSFASASGRGGNDDQPRGSSAGLTGGGVNAEDIGTASGADATGQPIAGSSAGMGGTGAGGNMGSPDGGNGLAGGGNGTGGGSSASDSIFQVPNFEPAVDKPAGAATLGQPGLLSGRGSQGGSAAGVQAPAFGLGQSVNGAKTPGADPRTAGSGGKSSQSGEATPSGADSPGLITSAFGRSQGTGGGNPGSGDSISGGGSGARAAGGKPGSEGSPGTNATGSGGSGQGQGQGPVRGFDWAEAAKDGPTGDATAEPAADQQKGGGQFGMDGGPQSPAAAARANVASGGALNPSSMPATVPPDLQTGAYQAGQYSQEDIERAKSLSGLSSLVSPGLAQKLAGAAAATGFTPSLPSSPESNSTSSGSQTGAMSSSGASSDSSSSNQTGGMPLGGNTQSSLSSSSSNSFSLNASPNSDEANELMMPPRPKPVLPTGAIEAPFQIVVVCRKDEVLLHPGSYRLTGDVLRSTGQGSDSMLAREILRHGSKPGDGRPAHPAEAVAPLPGRVSRCRDVRALRGGSFYSRFQTGPSRFRSRDRKTRASSAGNPGDGTAKPRLRWQPSPARRSRSGRGGVARANRGRKPLTLILRRRERSIAQVTSVLACVTAITLYVHLGAHRKAKPAASVVPAAALAAGEALPKAKIEPEATAKGAAEVAAVERPEAPPEIDQAAVALAEAELDAASGERARADERAAAAARRLGQATGQAALDAARARKLAFLVRDPSTRITQASTRGGFLRGERDKIQKQLSTLRELPRPKSTSILSKAPVARPASGNEYHFELRRNRITYINLEKLMEFTRADAQIRVRMSDRSPAMSNKVGPVGAFSLEYELVRAVPGSMEELLERKNIRYELAGWELVPESDPRGESYESTRGPLSEFSRMINRVSPERSTVTLWVYPDSFTLFRQIKADLADRGFSVAARPLPEGMTIRGSPMGTQSAAQ